MRQLKLAILGFGNVGQAVAELIINNHEKILEKYSTDVKVVAVATRSKGNLVAKEGLKLKEMLEDVRKTGKFQDVNHLTEMTNMDIIKKVDYDVLVELTPLNVETGEPAIGHIREAMTKGKGVVTANKGPIAWAFDQLNQLAIKMRVPFFYETTVMDGAPVFNMYDNCLRLAEVEEISGVLNTTTNFILGQLEEGVSLEEALDKGRAMGFVEEDPSLDLDGWDGAVKITALANVLMGAGITPDQVDRRGISGITGDELIATKKDGKTIKVMCRAWREESGKIACKVAPEKIDMTEKEALVDGTTSVVSITTDMMGKLTLFENDPNIYQTAYGVFGDILRVIVE